MAQFFRAPWADAVQVVAFPLEVVGLALAWIEVRRPPLALRISKLLIQAGSVRRYFYTNPGIEPLALRLFTALHALFLVGFWLWVIFGNWTLPQQPVVRLAAVAIALVFPLTAATVSLRLTASLLRALTRFSRGRALGAFGLLLAGVGIVGEAYQLLTLMLAK